MKYALGQHDTKFMATERIENSAGGIGGHVGTFFTMMTADKLRVDDKTQSQ